MLGQKRVAKPVAKHGTVTEGTVPFPTPVVTQQDSRMVAEVSVKEVVVPIKEEKCPPRKPGYSPFFTPISHVMHQAKRTTLEADDL